MSRMDSRLSGRGANSVRAIIIENVHIKISARQKVGWKEQGVSLTSGAKLDTRLDEAEAWSCYKGRDSVCKSE